LHGPFSPRWDVLAPEDGDPHCAVQAKTKVLGAPGHQTNELGAIDAGSPPDRREL
jgi:hypothetical protein